MIVHSILINSTYIQYRRNIIIIIIIIIYATTQCDVSLEYFNKQQYNNTEALNEQHIQDNTIYTYRGEWS